MQVESLTDQVKWYDLSVHINSFAGRAFIRTHVRMNMIKYLCVLCLPC